VSPSPLSSAEIKTAPYPSSFRPPPSLPKPFIQEKKISKRINPDFNDVSSVLIAENEKEDYPHHDPQVFHSEEEK